MPRSHIIMVCFCSVSECLLLRSRHDMPHEGLWTGNLNGAYEEYVSRSRGKTGDALIVRCLMDWSRWRQFCQLADQ